MTGSSVFVQNRNTEEVEKDEKEKEKKKPLKCSLL